ncbi:ABC transporter ATP-binding protein [Candidatus Parcubacteria bacterium]|nr:ABC transporter ATP-binding protein [Candidatus Parcubacteria bacterium]
MESLIKTENLSVIYNLGKSSESPAVLDVNIEIQPGEYIIFYGPSGCGKSTLLYCISGMETPTKGTIYIQGRNISTLLPIEMVEIRRLWIGMIFQAYNLIPTLNVLDNVVLPHLLGNFQKGETYSKADYLLKKFGISNLKYHYPLELSGGQQQRTAIVRALMYDSQILLADEPVGNLDSESAKIVMGLLDEINKEEKKTIILVTHDPQLLHHAHRVYHMKDGKIIREVVNSERTQIKRIKSKELVSSELIKMARIFPYLSEIQLRSKILAHYLTESLDIDKMQRLEKFNEKFILGHITGEKFYQLLYLPYEQGGIGFYEPTAEKYRTKIRKVLSQAKFLKQELERENEESEKAVRELDRSVYFLRTSLLDAYQGQISFEQLKRLDKFIEGRLLGSVERKRFQILLDLSLKDGGVGLNRATARKFTRKLEIILSQSKKL